jgi:hypothetical protein
MESTFEKIQRLTGKRPVSCQCNACKQQCTQAPCLGTPDDIINIIKAGYGDRLAPTEWQTGMRMGIIDRPVIMLQAEYDNDKKACTFFTNGLCQLHDQGLKPTEGKLSDHNITITNLVFEKSLSWAVAKEWLTITEDQLNQIIEKLYIRFCNDPERITKKV